MGSKQGRLYVVATPLGNRKDITERAREVLSEVDEWVVEDTRRSSKLAQMYEISPPPMNSYYDEVEEMRVEPLVRKLKSGKKLALLSDAGTPAISDPGYLLVKRAHEENIEVRPLPGANAPVAALSASGFPSDRYVFMGFLPRKNKARRDTLLEVKNFPGTVIFFESPRRLVDCLQKIRSFLGNRDIFIAREMTKKFEEYRRGTATELIDYYKNNESRGEFTVLVHPQDDEEETVDSRQYLRDLLRKGLKLSDAAKAAAKFSEKTRSELYKVGLDIQEELEDESK